MEFRYSINRSSSNIQQAFIEFFSEVINSILDGEETTIYIVSPWITNIKFTEYSSEGIGVEPYVMFRDLLSLFKWLGERKTLKVVVRSYDDLLAPDKLYTYLSLKEKMEETADIGLIELYRLSEEEVKRALEQILLVKEIIRAGAHVRFRPRLHSKIYVSPSSALLGSANLTHSGFKLNEEFLIRIPSRNPLYHEIKEAAENYFKSDSLTEEECERRTLYKLKIILNKYWPLPDDLNEFINFLRKEIGVY